MIGTTEQIGLPRWYASVSWGSREPGDSDGPPVRRVGPLCIFGDAADCQTYTFGRPEAPDVVVFDGYVFDEATLAAELGVCEGSATPALLAAAYARWGSGIFDRIDGCYLIAIWDEERKQLCLGHDALGRHPAFYARDERAFYFTSNLLTLAASGAIDARPNRVSLALSLLLFWPEAGETFIDGLHRVRPGHYLEVSSQAIREPQYWEPMPQDDEPWLSDDEVHDTFEPALLRSVVRCLEQGAQGIMLSGGVDSVTIAALAAEHGRRIGCDPLVAVSARTGQGLTDEERMQSRVSEVLGMPHVISTTPEWKQGRDDVSLSLEATPVLPSPTHIWWVGTYMRFYRRTAADNLTVLLTGAGGDNWLGVADAHAADLLGALRPLELVRFMKSDVQTAGASVRSSVRRLLWAGGVRPHLDSLWARVQPTSKDRYHARRWLDRLPDWLCPDEDLKQALLDRLLRRRTPALTDQGAPPTSYYRHTLRSLSNPYMHHENETAFHIESLCGLRLLSPYHDRRLVELFNRIPPRTLIHGDRYKGLLRPVVEKYLPALGLENQRKEYPAELQNRKLRMLQESVSAAWSAQTFDTLAAIGVVDRAKVRRQFGRPGAASFDEMARMFAVMSADAWTRTHARA